MPNVLSNIDPNIVSGAIGGVCGVISALITARLTSGAAKKQFDRTTAINAAYLTTQIAPTLRSYAATCLAVSYDDGHIHGQRAGSNGELAEVTVPSPIFKPTEAAVDWKSLPELLMSDLLTFPERAHDAAEGLSDHETYFEPPGHDDFFADRQVIYMQLGTAALDLVDRLELHVMGVVSAQSMALRTRLSERRSQMGLERERAAIRSTQSGDFWNSIRLHDMPAPPGS